MSFPLPKLRYMQMERLKQSGDWLNINGEAI